MLSISNFGITIWRFLQAPRDKYKIQNFTLPINWWYTITNFRKLKNFDQIDGPVWEIGLIVEYDIVFNVISKAVLPPLFATEVINHTSIGHAAYQDFVSNRFHGNISVCLFGLQCRNIIWNPLKQTTRWLKKIWPQSCTVAWGEKSTNKILDNSTKTTRAQFRRSPCKLWIFCGTKSTIF